MSTRLRCGFTAVLAACLILPCTGATPRTTAPVESAGFTKLTSYDTLQAFLSGLGAPCVVEPLCRTREGRTVSVVRVSSGPEFGADTTKLRILLFAQQHGDEPTGMEALTMLLARMHTVPLQKILETCDLLIVPQMNPDGGEVRRRRTSDTIDLNRNHVLLTSPETKALHDLFHRRRPHVSMDIHQYGSYSASWSDSGFIKTGDVQLGMLTNLNTSPAVRELQHQRIFPFIAERMNTAGYSFHEYIVGSPGDRIRHSTTEINDGRQSLGILGTVSFIQEGRKWRTEEEQLERCVRSQLTAVEALLGYCAAHAGEIRSVVEEERSRLLEPVGRTAAIRMEHRSGGGVLDIPVHILASGRDTVWRVKPYHDEVRLLTATTVPSGYVVAGADTAVIALLHRHQIRVDTLRTERTMTTIASAIDSIGWQVLEEDSLPRVFVTQRERPATLRPGDVLVPTSQLQSLLITILLEPESMWGLAKYEQFSGLLKRREFPILRIP